MAEIAVVTGANRGLGLEVARQLARQGMRVVMTSRDRAAGEEAAAPLRREGLAVEVRELDVADPGSAARFAGAIDGPVRALVNNAGASFSGFDGRVAERTLATNYSGAAAVTDALVPRLAPGARVVMVSSGMGELTGFAPELRARFLAPDLDRAGLDALAREFVEAVRRGDHAQRGWPSNAYKVSKAAMNALVRILAPALASRQIAVNAVSPGWVRTDMGGRGAPRSVEKGASGIVWAATLPPGGPTGGFFGDGKPIPW
jgi:NAD(P)-dependent dehydrogenase (short-subunit alcohol dehydrogenase family)